jgi:pimeloyl-ACP methyl ester carboxylesterase
LWWAARWAGGTAIDLALANPGRVSALILIGSSVSGAPYSDITQEPIASIVKAAEDAETTGDLDELHRQEAHLWLDGPTAPEGRVGGGVRELFLEMNGRALRTPDPGDPVGRRVAAPQRDRRSDPRAGR